MFTYSGGRVAVHSLGPNSCMLLLVMAAWVPHVNHILQCKAACSCAYWWGDLTAASVLECKFYCMYMYAYMFIYTHVLSTNTSIWHGNLHLLPQGSGTMCGSGVCKAGTACRASTMDYVLVYRASGIQKHKRRAHGKHMSQVALQHTSFTNGAATFCAWFGICWCIMLAKACVNVDISISSDKSMVHSWVCN